MSSQLEDNTNFDFVSFYDQNAALLAEQYEAISIEAVHGDLLEFLPPLPARALDVGAGSGRDANWLAARGFQVVAVEPSEELRNIAVRLHPSPLINWLDDRLPSLEKLPAYSAFNLILCSAVWMHLSRQEQQLAMRRLSALISSNGRICITFRSIADEKIPLYEVVAGEVIGDAKLVGFELLKQTTSPDWRNRENIVWHSLIFQNGGDQQ